MNSTMAVALRWSARELPKLTTAGEFAHDDRDFAHQYGPSPHHALHLYGYPGVIRTLGRDTEFATGDLTLTPAGAPSAYDLRRPGRHHCIHFAGRKGAGLRAALPLHLSLAGRVEQARSKFMWIAYLWGDRARSPVAEAAAAAATLELLLWIAASAETASRAGVGPRTLAAVERAAQILTERARERIDVAALCRQVGVSQNYLARAFRACTGVTMSGYLIRRRIELARHLLEQNEEPISIIGLEVGFGDPQHFNKAFRQVLGMSPSAYRERRGLRTAHRREKT